MPYFSTLQFDLMRPVGFEPTSKRFRDARSAIELRALSKKLYTRSVPYATRKNHKDTKSTKNFSALCVFVSLCLCGFHFLSLWIGLLRSDQTIGAVMRWCGKISCNKWNRSYYQSEASGASLCAAAVILSAILWSRTAFEAATLIKPPVLLGVYNSHPHSGQL
jgi:hypothetical protein